MNPCYLSHFIEESTPVYGGVKKTISLNQISSIKNGDTANSKKICFPNHVGTHIDFPNHFGNDGKKCLDYPASFWIFNKVGFLDCSIDEVPDKILMLPKDIELLILKTGFGENRNKEIYWSSQPVIPASFALLFRNAFPNLRVFGFDMISLTSKLNRVEGKKAHIAFLLDQDILILEDMNIDNLFVSPQKVIISPLQIGALDGAPCTVIAF
ncbi:cyclase family protein [Flavobacteriaceae bacterium]|jgi:arylformamidase|nr:cyclase family protein [Flavobacteriaceae bacterium]